ncbi:MAG TPA: alpha/beta fold hydrolase [Verrucomicrobiae bacterium]|nr:alpha/beta fold hydrolase [Verrucomicrobiae bacterium]
MIREHTIGIGALELDCGQRLPAVEQRVTIDGDLAANGENAVLIAHALTGSSRVAEWWPDIVGEGGPFDTRAWCAIGINVLGGRYGSTGPSNAGEPFANVTVRDMVRAQARALRALGIERLAYVVGGSLGGMQALQWALDYPQRVGAAIVVGAHDHHSAMGIALNGIQRECLALDPVRGLRTARKLAMLTYKSEALLSRRHGRRRDRAGGTCFDVESYLERAAEGFAARMDAATYATLTHAMDAFDVRDATAVAASPPLHFIGISSDWLFRPGDVRAAAERLRGHGFSTTYVELESDHGHDAFLAEGAALAALFPHRRELTVS